MEQKQTVGRTKLYLKTGTVLLAVLTLAGILLRTAALSGCYDKEIGYYQRGAVLPMVFHGLCVLMLVLCAVGARLLPSSFAVKADVASSLLTRGGTVLALLCVMAHVLQMVIAVLGGTESLSVLLALRVFFGILTAVYLAAGLVPSSAVSGARALFGYGAIAYIVAMMAASYFDFFLQMNSPNKLLFQVSCMILLLYLLCDLRLILSIAMPRAYCAMTGVTVFYTFSYAVPGIFGFCTGILPRVDYLMTSIVLLGFGLYSLGQWIARVAALPNP